ncbi:uncharacterized protein LOC124273948 [Haliotis rubra]|uniref:uncharacterized protein LOC124273948 n=1 Tax=Haliotis rubra TaxID=36100 RepID=UPI001EE53288|nr:uncharacterized protein LOC124273948 [Haliotis rubra]XP_046565250.1 uncharacterized protein LOC124273948 [Haliotis rubra]XP_046565251.1 uncharacterized protein LOC124273948 [Haliotis rubra]XP_046565252.1 uncharacterized protein LOC124273948 [Haliotis rubra]
MGEGGTNCIFLLIGAGVGIVVLLVVILVPMSFSDLEYYEIAFKRRKSTGAVDTSRVYSGGKYFIGPDFEFKKYTASAHYVFLNDVAVFTSDKLEVLLDVSFQYFLRPEDLKQLHSQYDISYEAVMRTSAVDALKGEAPTFTTRQYVSDRAALEAAMFKGVRERLGGKCCAKNCKSFKFACPPGCKEVRLCTTADKGLFVDVKYFQLGQVQIPSDVKDRFLRALTLQEDALREQLLQDAQIVRKQTDVEVRQIKNDGKEISANATAQSTTIATLASANYTLAVESARSQGLKKLYTKLGINEQKFKNSFDYLRTLRGMDHVHFTVDFQQRIVGNMGST